jgi:uncharacterized protein
MRIFLGAIAAFMIAGAAFAQAICSDDRLELRGDWGSARFRVEVADDVQERATGLMFRESMPSLAGMLFVYERPQSVAFWMENTLIPLDMIFADPTGTVTRIHENAIPRDRTPIPGGDNIRFVLEINGGMSETLGITVGSQMRHPAIDPEQAAWAC